MNQKKKVFRQILMILVLAVALVGVIYAAQYARGPGFRAGLELFFNPDLTKTWNWCPEGAEKIEFHKQEKQNIEISQICNVTLGAVPNELSQLKMEKWITVSSKGVSKTLEADENLRVFQVDELLFSSEKLSQLLKP